MSWQPGDRVRLWMDYRYGGRNHPAGAWFTGTVREVDPPGLPPGVRVDLDEPVKGTSDCFATHDELVVNTPVGGKQEGET